MISANRSATHAWRRWALRSIWSPRDRSRAYFGRQGHSYASCAITCIPICSSARRMRSRRWDHRLKGIVLGEEAAKVVQLPRRA